MSNKKNAKKVTKHNTNSHKKANHDKVSHKKVAHKSATHKKASKKTVHKKADHNKTSHKKTTHKKVAHKKVAHKTTAHNTASKKASKKVAHKKTAHKKASKKAAHKKKSSKVDSVEKSIDHYEFVSQQIPIKVTIKKTKEEYVPVYEVQISSISRTTEFILEKIRQELIKSVNLGLVDITNEKKTEEVEDKFKATITVLISKYFPDVAEDTKGFLISYLVAKSLGLGTMELLMSDEQLEEIVVNGSQDPVWVYHKKHGWLKTNIFLKDEEQIRHFASIIGRRVGRQITVLSPLLDAHLNEGDRVNATIMPISTAGNTITLRKFSRDPWTITKFLEARTISSEAAALIWLAMEYEMSALIAGGTASGKTSALNVLANFFPPNQRIISIEDTREIRLPKYLHWVPMNTRLANAEGKGEISMENLLVNSLRMRPDRILVGEVRRQREAETLFEAIHTGHSVYATFHANNAIEAVDRLTNPPINVPKMVLPAVSLVIVQFRNRRTGSRRTFQIAEILPDASVNVLMQYDNHSDKLVKKANSKVFMQNISLYTGLSIDALNKDMAVKQKVLDYMVKNKIREVDEVGEAMAEYYTNREIFLKKILAKTK